MVYALSIAILLLFVTAMAWFLAQAMFVPGQFVPGLVWGAFSGLCAVWWASRMDQDHWRRGGGRR